MTISPAKIGRPLNPTARKVTSKGHVIIRIGKVWVPEHRYILAQRLGRDLRSTEKVKWKDGDKTNNLESNLEIWEETKTWPV